MNFPVCSGMTSPVCSGMTSPMREKVDLTRFQRKPSRKTTPMMKSGEPDEVELNTVTISNMSIDSKPVETDGRRGWREITGDCGAGE